MIDLGKVALFEVSIKHDDEPATSPLNDSKKLKKILRDIAKACNLTILRTSTHQFEPYGVTSLFLLSESHLSIHTWPEHGKFAMDVYSCNDNYSEMEIENIIRKYLPVEHIQVEIKNRVFKDIIK
jgi:S-adenosylmethionine decarboxylase